MLKGDRLCVPPGKWSGTIRFFARLLGASFLVGAGRADSPRDDAARQIDVGLGEVSGPITSLETSPDVARRVMEALRDALNSTSRVQYEASESPTKLTEPRSGCSAENVGD